jgi:hypothetical protein
VVMGKTSSCDSGDSCQQGAPYWGPLTCQLALETAGTVLDASNGSGFVAYYGNFEYWPPSVVSALSTVALSSPDTVLYQCVGGGSAQNSQVVAILVGAIN